MLTNLLIGLERVCYGDIRNDVKHKKQGKLRMKKKKDFKTSSTLLTSHEQRERRKFTGKCGTGGQAGLEQ